MERKLLTTAVLPISTPRSSISAFVPRPFLTLGAGHLLELRASSNALLQGSVCAPFPEADRQLVTSWALSSVSLYELAAVSYFQEL
jgi:hypothetical protein